MSQVNLNHALFAEAKNKTILITGAAHGIGLATAKLVNEKGANVILADLSQFRTEAEEAINTQLAHPDRAVFFPANIVDWTELTDCFENSIARFGGLDVVVANAGIMESRPVLNVEDVDENGRLLDDHEAGRVIDVNLKGTLNTSKHGVLGLLRGCQTTAQKYGVRVNAIAPFLTPTHITAGFAQRWDEAGLEKNTPERVAEAIALVALDRERAGDCVMVAGRFLRELERPRTKLFPQWFGEDVAEFLGRAMRFFVSIGGYVLPSKY
ncbi:Short-chain dehydrogenase/reductase SDR [Penicillium nucicola]|uniref:Short-chain dehydrogenase/reductase SDR n=1 Tax=Penicillium nucicola TaxID=1850975 RepID=UPI002545AF9C|nr:Short-chain dehydrogenase/reductase SDR [Penicillium nucicola]KAJ5757721.1 Short-chain dehydrogenase/reductase SDR [Penicillium nucicola]